MKTSLNSKVISKEEVHSSYKNLQKVERAFRTIKTTLLEVRPLYLHSDKKIKGHVFLTGLAYNVVKELEKYVKELEIDLETILEELKKVTTIKTVLAKKVVEYVPQPNEIISLLLSKIGINFPKKLI